MQTAESLLSSRAMELRDATKEFVTNEVEPRAREIEDTDRIPGELIQRAKEIGLFAMSVPEEYGGLGLTMTEKAAVYEELGKTSNAFTTVIGCHTGIGSVGIVELANEEQKRRYLPRMASGELVGAFALTEPEAGTDAANVQTRAVRDGDNFVLNGHKRYITNGPIADVVTVMASTEPEKGPRGITAFIVESGFSVGEHDDKMGLRGSYTGELFFEDCAVPEENVLGEEGRGYANALRVLAAGRAGLPARNLGSCQKLLELSLSHAKTREQFGAPIFEQQIIQHYLAEMAVEIEALRAMVYRVAEKVDSANVGERIIKEAAMVKLHGSEVYNRIADKAVQIHGGAGYMKEHQIERYYRDARITRIYEGTSETQKNIIARQLGREYDESVAQA